MQADGTYPGCMIWDPRLVNLFLTVEASCTVCIYVSDESRKREIKAKLIYENRYNERLKN